MTASELPSSARLFLRTDKRPRTEQVVRHFHRWMKAKHVISTGLSLEEVESFFVQSFRRTVSPRISRVYKSTLVAYLDWLDERGLLGFDPRELTARRKRPLPLLAVAFLRSLAPTHKVTTRNGYRSSLTRFHEWVADNGISLKRLKRSQIEHWLLALSDEGLHVATRRDILTTVRTYFRWLVEQGELRADPDELIRSADLPKLPVYLPRPLSPDEDTTLQQRLEASPNRLHKALLLMRLTGLRIGELANLPFACLRDDSRGNTFLKVPLGKLNNERLVPIDQRARKLVDALQQTGAPEEREYLVDNPAGKRVAYDQYRRALLEACDGIDSTEPITSHRLRHTYATTMLTAGVSLPSVMRLLGHRDVRMTLRYAAITQETLTKEYFDALPEIESRYQHTLRSTDRTRDFDPIKSLADTSHWIRKHIAAEPKNDRIVRSLLKRLARVQADLQEQIAADSQ